MTVYEVLVTVTVVPLPWVKPIGPYSISQAVAVPISVQERVMLLGVMLDAVKFIGVIQEGRTSTIMLSMKPGLVVVVADLGAIMAI